MIPPVLSEDGFGFCPGAVAVMNESQPRLDLIEEHQCNPKAETIAKQDEGLADDVPGEAK